MFFVEKYEDTIDTLTFHFEKVNTDFFRSAYEDLERLAINTPLNISLTAEKDADNILCESILEYNYTQERLNFITNCRQCSKEYGKYLNTTNDNTKVYEKIINDNPGFIENFSECEPWIAKKLMGNNMYNVFLRCYISNSTIVKALSECYYNYTKQREDGRKLEYLPDNAKEYIVKHIGGVAAITEIDNGLENNNSTNDQQDEAVNLHTSGTTADCCHCVIT